MGAPRPPRAHSLVQLHKEELRAPQLCKGDGAGSAPPTSPRDRHRASGHVPPGLVLPLGGVGGSRPCPRAGLSHVPKLGVAVSQSWAWPCPHTGLGHVPKVGSAISQAGLGCVPKLGPVVSPIRAWPCPQGGLGCVPALGMAMSPGWTRLCPCTGYGHVPKLGTAASPRWAQPCPPGGLNCVPKLGMAMSPGWAQPHPHTGHRRVPKVGSAVSPRWARPCPQGELSHVPKLGLAVSPSWAQPCPQGGLSHVPKVGLAVSPRWLGHVPGRALLTALPHPDAQLAGQLGHHQEGSPALPLLGLEDVPKDVVPHAGNVLALHAQQVTDHVRGACGSRTSGPGRGRVVVPAPVPATHGRWPGAHGRSRRRSAGGGQCAPRRAASPCPAGPETPRDGVGTVTRTCSVPTRQQIPPTVPTGPPLWCPPPQPLPASAQCPPDGESPPAMSMGLPLWCPPPQPVPASARCPPNSKSPPRCPWDPRYSAHNPNHYPRPLGAHLMANPTPRCPGTPTMVPTTPTVTCTHLVPT